MKILEDWKEHKFGDVVKLSNEKYYPDKDEHNFRCIELDNIEQESGRINGWIDSELQKSTKNRFKKGDVLYGKLRPYLKKYYYAEFDGVCSTEIWVLKNKTSYIQKKYIFYLIQTEKFNNVANVSTGSRMPRADWEYVKNTSFKIPPLPEQQKIAQTLSTWDQAIELKEKLIEEKKEQKKGLMQNLLTGKVRLPGFEGEWEEVRIKNIGVLKSGSGFPLKYQGNNNGEYPFFKVSDMNLEENAKYMIKANNYIDESVKNEVNPNVIPKDSIIFAKVGAALLLERKRIVITDSCIDNNMMALIVDYIKNDYLFVYYSLLNIRLSKFCNTGALPSLNAGDIYGIKLTIPKSLREQKAIANILSTADKEINLHQQELEQLKLQKKGLMQLLLTGKVRVNY